MNVEKAKLNLANFLKENPDMVSHQIELADKMKYLTDPKDRLAFLLSEVKKKQADLNGLFKGIV